MVGTLFFMANFLFLPDLRGHLGHFTPLACLAQGLINNGHKTLFVGNATTESLCHNHCLEHENLFALNTILDKVLLNFSSSHKQLDQLITQFHPDLLIADYFSTIGALCIYHRYDLNFVTVTSFLRHNLDTPLIYTHNLLKELPTYIYEKLLSFSGNKGVDLFTEPLCTNLELIACPKELEIVNKLVIQHRTHYIEPLVTRIENGIQNKTAYRHEQGQTTLYCSFGSMLEDYQDLVLSLFVNLLQMMQRPDMQSFHLIMATGKLTPSIQQFQIPANVWIYDWGDPMEVLKTASLAIHHGGLGTLKECIYNDVPSIVIPLGKDHFDNAFRVDEKKIGTFLYAQKADQESLAVKVQSVLHDNTIKNSLQLLGKLFKEKEEKKESHQLLLDEIARIA